MRILIVKEPECPICSQLQSAKEHSIVVADDLEVAQREIRRGLNLFDLVILYSPFSQIAGAAFTEEVKKLIPRATVVLRNQTELVG